MKTYQEFINESLPVNHPDYIKDLEEFLIVKVKNDAGKFELYKAKGRNGFDNKAVSDAFKAKGLNPVSSWAGSMTYAVSPRSLKAVKAGQFKEFK